MRYEQYTMIGKLNTKNINTKSVDLVDMLVGLSPDAQQLFKRCKDNLEWSRSNVILDINPAEVTALMLTPAFIELNKAGILNWIDKDKFILNPNFILPWAADYDQVKHTFEYYSMTIVQRQSQLAAKKKVEQAKQRLCDHDEALKIHALMSGKESVIKCILGLIPHATTQGALIAKAVEITGTKGHYITQLLNSLDGIIWKKYRHREKLTTSTRYKTL